MNELVRRTDLVTGQHVYAPNYHLILELVYGCNRACEFCGCGDGAAHFMSEEVFARVLTQMDKKTKRVTWNIGGESTLHPELLTMVARAKKKVPHAYFDIITNGDVKVLKPNSIAFFEQLFDAGMNSIHFDVYEDEDMPKAKALLKDTNFTVVEYGKGGAFWGRKDKKRTVVLMASTFGVNRKIDMTSRFSTQAGSTPLSVWEKYGVEKTQFPLRKACSEPLKYTTIKWDGAYSLCCADHDSPTDWGNILNMSVEELWWSEKRRMAQLALSKGMRELIPSCYMCNRLSMRNGLYPYPYVDSWSKGLIARTLCAASSLRHNIKEAFAFYDKAQKLSPEMTELYRRSK